jgi:hypothetical protein
MEVVSISAVNHIRSCLLFAQLWTACTGVSASSLRDFRSDGCSLFPDGTIGDRALWCGCCLAHDIAYWQGGTKEERKQADETLRDCVLNRTGNKTLAVLMYDGIRVGGHPAFPMWYRWGYGWNYGRGYVPLNEQELQQVRERLDDYYRKHPAGYCREKHE